MTTTFRHYHHLEDYQNVDDFLIQNYQPDNQDGNWVEPAWEYMHFHSLLDSNSWGRSEFGMNPGKLWPWHILSGRWEKPSFNFIPPTGIYG